MTSEQLQDHHNKLHNTNWKHIKLDDIITLEYGKGLTKESRDNGEYPVYGSNGIVGYHSDFLIEGPVIIVGRKGTVGAISWSKCNCWPIDTTYYVKKKGSEIDYCWLYYKLKSLALSKLNMATGIPGLNRDHVYSTNIQLPPIPEQHKIASILSKVDEHIFHTEAIIEKTEELKRGLMQQLLTKGIGHTKFKNTEIGEIPEEWDVIKLKELIALEYGKALNKDSRKDGKYPVYGSNGLIGYHSSYLVEGPAIIVGRKGTVGAINISDSSCWPIDTTYYISTNENNVHTRWLFYKLKYLKLSNLNMATGVPGINRDMVYAQSVVLPPLIEQRKIALIISKIDDHLALNQNYLSKIKELKQGLMQDLLMGKVKVDTKCY